MSKKLAIKGHATRGKEVIELFKMMGAKHFVLDGTNDWYVINDLDNSITFYDHNYINCHEFVKFTLEEFLDKYPFKVGDKVVDCYGKPLTIKSMEWSEDCETMVYDFEDSVVVLAAEDLLKWNAEFLVNKEKSEEVGKMLCDMTLKHLHGNHLKNVLSELYEHIKTTSKEDLEQEFKEIESEGWTNVGPTVEEFMTFCECVNKKSMYPKTYEKCCKITEDVADASLTCFACNLLNNFQKLLLCRDAYWEIAGEEMGLGKPWEPDWDNGLQKKYAIYPNLTDYVLGSKNKIYVGNTRILVFPTEDMRDVFYENFKDLIEECKELL
jgi:hypothetical protein